MRVRVYGYGQYLCEGVAILKQMIDQNETVGRISAAPYDMTIVVNHKSRMA